MWCRLLITTIFGFLFIGANSKGLAATLTWTGSAGDNNIYNRLNWSPSQVPVTGDTLIYAGAAGLAPQLTTSMTVGAITFSSTAQAFTLGGAGTYTINSGVSNSSTLTETINNAITLGANQSWDAASGALVFGGPVNLLTRTLSLTGAKATTISGSISGTGGLTLSGTGNVTLSGNNTYSGITSLQKGTLTIGSNTALGAGTFLFDGGTLAATGGATHYSQSGIQ